MISPQELIDRVLAAAKFDDCFVIVQDSTEANLRWANNTLTTLKLFNRLASFRNLRAVVYSSAGCTVAEKLYGDARPTTEEDPVSLHLDSPYQISKIVGEMYANYFHAHDGLPTVVARFQNVYGPGEILGAGQWRGTPATVWRNTSSKERFTVSVST